MFNHAEDTPLTLTEVRTDGGGALVGWTARHPHALSWSALAYRDEHQEVATIALGDGRRYPEKMIEDWVMAISCGTEGEAGYPAGTVLFRTESDAEGFLLDDHHSRQHV